MVINKKADKIQNLFVLQIPFFPLKFVVIISVYLLYDFGLAFVILLHVITESSIKLAKYL